MSDASENEPEPEPLAPEEIRRLDRHGALLIALGLAGILWGVFHILGPIGDMRAQFPGQRVGYDMHKRLIHQTFGGGLVRALIGLGVAIYGGSLRRRAHPERD